MLFPLSSHTSIPAFCSYSTCTPFRVHRREITVEVTSEGFYRTGIRPDVTQFALNMASFITHVRCILSLKSLEKRLDWEFKDISILHVSFATIAFPL